MKLVLGFLDQAMLPEEDLLKGEPTPYAAGSQAFSKAGLNTELYLGGKNRGG
jgi:hypothetical protein